MQRVVTKVLGPFGLTALLAAAACKPAADSQVQSLDNFVDEAAGNATTDNVCGVAYDSRQGSSATAKLPKHVQALIKRGFIKAKGKMRDEVIGTLAAVPAPMLAPLVLAGGKIEVASSEAAAAKACAGAELTEGEKNLAGDKQVTSCWLAGDKVRIILPPKSAAIRHSLLRAISYFYTEVFVDRASLGIAPFDAADWKKELRSFRDTRDGLREAFLLDIELKDAAAHKKLTTSLSEAKLGNYVYAEALDSYYCKASMADGQPRARFKARFPAAWKIFTDAKNPNSPVNLFGR